MRYIQGLIAGLTVVLLLAGLPGQAKENVDQGEEQNTQKRGQKQLRAGCEPPEAAVFLDVNNVRARIMNGGDMWWDLVSNARYIVPNTEEPPFKTSLFAGSLWLGGFDQGGNLRASAMTYRQSGVDYWPGPLDTADASVSQQVCDNYDRMWKVNRDDIEALKEGNTDEIPADIQDWPTRGDVTKGQSRYLAPFVDVDNNGLYEPRKGDYPDVPGDQAVYFIYNDKGNIHSETDATAIGIEIRTTAFAFSTNDQVNNQTFYEHTIVNRSNNRLDSMHIGQWVDPDLGNAFDDYVGCDTSRSLGYCYNGDNFDETNNGYGQNPPSVGVDFFEGPKTMDGEELKMESFIYYDNINTVPYGNPTEAQHYYNYLTGTWKDGQSVTENENGRVRSNAETNFMFPGDPIDQQGWTEGTAGNNPFDRRFIQSSGPFTLMPGAVNNVTVGVIWANATSGGNIGSLDLLRVADDRAQQLYNNDFEILNGPPAPTIKAQELDREIIISLKDTEETENYIAQTLGAQQSDTIEYQFEGYKILQLANASVSPSQFDNRDLARQIRQVDVDNQISTLVNEEFNPDVNEFQSTLEVQGSDDGIRHNFKVTTDAFASGSDRLINNKEYHFVLIPYASYNPRDEGSEDADRQYLERRRLEENKFSVVPHKVTAEKGGVVQQANYGDQPRMTRLEGVGNGGLVLDLTKKTRDEILENGGVENPTYVVNGGPADVFVHDPLNVPRGNFMFRFQEEALEGTQGQELTEDATWSLTRINSGGSNRTVNAQQPVGANYEQVIDQFGLSAKPQQVIGPSLDTVGDSLGFQRAEISYEAENSRWLTGVNDQDRPENFTIPLPVDWIRSGELNEANQTTDGFDLTLADASVPTSDGGWRFIDPNEVYEGLLDGIVAPYGLTAIAGRSGGVPTFGPAIESNVSWENGSIENLHSVDLVFTNDKDKWTQCVVIEMNPSQSLSEGDAEKFDLRDHGSWLDPNAIEDGEPQYVDKTEDKGRSWFPGYAINLETGKRLNIIFGEDSWLPGENGDDMLWNPTSNELNAAAGATDFDRYPFGGKHYIYIMGEETSNPLSNNADEITSTYDRGETYQRVLQGSNNRDINGMFGAGMWVMLPLQRQGFEYRSLEEGLIPTRTEVSLRVDVPYETASTEVSDENGNVPMYSFNTNGLATVVSEDMGKAALDNVRAVPNPYYAFSSYERGQLDNRVRITNLPQECEISIYTLDGKLVRQFNKDQTAENHQTYLDWNLRNEERVPIGSGIFLIHVDAFDLGSTTIKWFGIRRPLDLDTF